MKLKIVMQQCDCGAIIKGINPNHLAYLFRKHSLSNRHYDALQILKEIRRSRHGNRGK